VVVGEPLAARRQALTAWTELESLSDPTASRIERVKAPVSVVADEAVRCAIRRGRPYGAADGPRATATRLGRERFTHGGLAEAEVGQSG
jgi:hypothetical protein